MKEKENISENVKKPWPTKQAMQQVYTNGLWGGKKDDFYSGEGSHHPELVEPYIDTLISFLTSFKNPPSLCDLGCGDFNVGRELVKYTEKYIAVDIVPDLIEYNKGKFKEKNLEFHCLDISMDSLPSGDCVLLRQVLQHLSNSEIQRILNKLINYKYIILTEHIPDGIFVPNQDIISGQGIRLKKQSGLDILDSPFNFKVINKKELLSIKLNDGNGLIVTTQYQIF